MYTNAHFWNPYQNSEVKNVFEVNYLKKKIIRIMVKSYEILYNSVNNIDWNIIIRKFWFYSNVLIGQRDISEGTFSCLFVRACIYSI